MSDIRGDWPVAMFGPIARARALASSIPGAAWAEGILDAPYETAWPWIADLETSVPRFDSQVHKLRVLTRAAEGSAQRLRVAATSFGVAVPFEVRLEDGFCLMQARARLYLVIMAAEPLDAGARTRFFHLEAVPLPGTRLLRSILHAAWMPTSETSPASPPGASDEAGCCGGESRRFRRARRRRYCAPVPLMNRAELQRFLDGTFPDAPPPYLIEEVGDWGVTIRLPVTRAIAGRGARCRVPP